MKKYLVNCVFCLVLDLLLVFSGGALAAPPDDLDQSSDAGAATLRFNFRDVALDTVLDYLSEAAGFTVVREATVEGHVDIVSHQPLNKDEAVALLNTVLNSRGYAAIRNERTLTIVRSEDAKLRNIPVRSGNSPEDIPQTGEMVTQIIPVRHADVTQLLENITPLLPPYAVASANVGSNAIVLTDTQADIRRMAEIITALDTSISEISEIRVFALHHANAIDTAGMINALFQLPPSHTQAAAAQSRAGGRNAPPPPAEAPSAAKIAASRVKAVADDRTNSVIVSAPGESMPLIANVIQEVDMEGMPVADYRVFTLKFADAGEMAEIINDAFGPNAAVGATSGRQTARVGAKSSGGKAASPNSRQATTLAHAVPDFRTNSVVVAAEDQAMEQVAQMIEKLESNPALDQKVFIYKLKNADAREVANVLMGMFAQSGSGSYRSRAVSSRSRSTSRR